MLDLGLDEPVGTLIRSRLNKPGMEHANIKALMSKIDRVADLDPQPENVDGREIQNHELQALRPRDTGLIVLYPIDKTSSPKSSPTAESPRVALDALEHVIGVGLVFPSTDDLTPQSYLAAALTPPEDLEDAQEQTEELLKVLDQAEEERLAEEEESSG